MGAETTTVRMKVAMDSSSSWISRSGQAWKLHVFYGSVVVTIALIAAFIASVNDIEVIPGVSELGLAILFIGSGLGGLCWLVYSIRCPGCGHRPVWPVLKQANAGSWLPTLLAMPECPSCHANR